MFAWLLLSCAVEDLPSRQRLEITPPPPAFCEGEVAHRYDPFGSAELEAFPDDLLTVYAPDSPTGLELDYSGMEWFEALDDFLKGAVRPAPGTSGFGRLGAVVLRFDGDVGNLEGSDALRLLDLSTTPPEPVPFDLHTSDDGTQIVLQPLRPLTAGARHVAILTTDHVTPSGDCVAPSATTRSLVGPEPPEDPRLLGLAQVAYVAMRDAGVDDEEVSALTVFTTHADHHLLQGVAADLEAAPPSWSTPPTCTPEGELLRCAGMLRSADHRDSDGIIGRAATQDWDVPVSIWLPNTPGPHPLVLFGHGLESSRNEAAAHAQRLAPLGFAVAAADAMHHGDHPTAGDGFTALLFLGIDLSVPVISSVDLRASFEQTAIDRLALLSALRAQPDLDGDGTLDVDPERIAYLGVSLGGCWAPRWWRTRTQWTPWCSRSPEAT